MIRSVNVSKIGLGSTNLRDLEMYMKNREWYGDRAKEIERDYSVIDYGCEGRGMVTNYSLFNGIQITFLDFYTTYRSAYTK